MKLIDVSVLKEWVENWFTKNRFYHPFAKNNNIPITELYDILEQLPSAEPEPSIARDIATIIENEMDMRVVLKNAELGPCDFCIYNEDCEEMRIYCPARGRTDA